MFQLMYYVLSGQYHSHLRCHFQDGKPVFIIFHFQMANICITDQSSQLRASVYLKLSTALGDGLAVYLVDITNFLFFFVNN